MASSFAVPVCSCGARRVDKQLGLEATPAEYVQALVDVFREVRRVLRDDGTVWLVLGDSYAANRSYQVSDSKHKAHDFGDSNATQVPPGLKPKDLIGIPWMTAFALRDDGWWLRADIIWCLSGGAKVYARTQKGDMPMTVKDLVRLDPATVKLWNGERWTQALGWSRSEAPRDGALEVQLRSGERIGCTLEHLWPTQRGNVRADELLAGDVIASTVLPEPDTPDTPAALDDAQVGWMAGRYLADGSTCGDAVQLACHADEADGLQTIASEFGRAYHGSAVAHRTRGKAATVNLNGPLSVAVIRAYVYGTGAHDKGIQPRAWRRSNVFLRALLDGYLSGDGSYDASNDRWRLAFTRNDRLAADLRTLCARLGVTLTLHISTATGFGRTWPCYRGELRFNRSGHHNQKERAEVVGIGRSRARQFWDIGVADAPHTFALASGVLTHNSKPNPMPESVTDRCTRSHEQVFMLAKRANYYMDMEAIKEPSGANKRSVWTVATTPYPGAHFAVFSPKLVEPMVLAGSAPKACGVCGAPWERVVERESNVERSRGSNPSHHAAYGKGPQQGEIRVRTCTTGWRPTCAHDDDTGQSTVLDPFCGTATTGEVAIQNGRGFIGIELSPEYAELARRRLSGVTAPLFT